MDDHQKTPEQSCHKAAAAAIAAPLTAIVLAFSGLAPTTEEVLAAELKALVEAIASLALLIAVPGLATFYKRNYPR